MHSNLSSQLSLFVLMMARLVIGIASITFVLAIASVMDREDS